MTKDSESDAFYVDWAGQESALPIGSSVRFKFSRGDYIDAWLDEKSGQVNITASTRGGGGSLAVHPRASNALRLSMKREE